jgi:hypothetical protein
MHDAGRAWPNLILIGKKVHIYTREADDEQILAEHIGLGSCLHILFVASLKGLGSIPPNYSVPIHHCTNDCIIWWYFFFQTSEIQHSRSMDLTIV